jgi:purine nucleosidase/pyrimidine-specific ribonucleoside hydrolase
VTVPVLIDTDPGIDDALALLLAFRSPEWRVEAVTTVAGNVPVELGTANTRRLAGVAGVAPMVAIGARGPLVGPLVTATHVHGDDGLGGLAHALPEAPVEAHPGDAADLLIACARRWAGELVVVALGPLTNLAVALERDRAALAGVRAVVVMGGAAAVGGNVTAAAEFNVFVDPEAAHAVLAAGLPLTLVPLDVTSQVVWPAARIDRLAGTSGSTVAGLAAALAGRGLALARAEGAPGIVMHDPLAVAVALDPSLVEAPLLPVAVETTGGLTRGATVVDRRPGRAPSGPACRVALRVDAGRALRLFEERVCGASA